MQSLIITIYDFLNNHLLVKYKINLWSILSINNLLQSQLCSGNNYFLITSRCCFISLLKVDRSSYIFCFAVSNFLRITCKQTEEILLCSQRFQFYLTSDKGQWPIWATHFYILCKLMHQSPKKSTGRSKKPKPCTEDIMVTSDVTALCHFAQLLMRSSQ